jgi:hypothetical protein
VTVAEGLSLVVAVGVVYVASGQLRRLYEVIDLELDVLLEGMIKAGVVGARRNAALSCVASESKSAWLRELCTALTLPDPERRALACDEALAEIDGALSVRARFASDALRLSVFSGLFCLALLVVLRDATPETLANVVAVGAGSLMVVLHLRHRTTSRDAADRRAIDRWVAAWTKEEIGEASATSVLTRPTTSTRVDSHRLASRRSNRGSRSSRR